MRAGMPSWARQETAPATWKPFMLWKMLVCAGGDGRSAVICSSNLLVLGSERGSIHRIFVRDSTCAFVALRDKKSRSLVGQKAASVGMTNLKSKAMTKSLARFRTGGRVAG